MRLKIVSDGFTNHTKIINADTGEQVENVQSFTIYGDTRKGRLVRATIEFVQMEFDVTAEREEGIATPAPEKKKKKKKEPKKYDPTEHTKNKLKEYRENTPAGEAFTDIENAEKGISSKDRLSWFTWWCLQAIFEVNPKAKIKVKDVELLLRVCQFKDGVKDLVFEPTTVNHTVNRFHFQGLMGKVKVNETFCIYSLDPLVKKLGMDWFRKGNKYLKDEFQFDSGETCGFIEDPLPLIKERLRLLYD